MSEKKAELSSKWLNVIPGFRKPQPLFKRGRDTILKISSKEDLFLETLISLLTTFKEKPQGCAWSSCGTLGIQYEINHACGLTHCPFHSSRYIIFLQTGFLPPEQPSPGQAAEAWRQRSWGSWCTRPSATTPSLLRQPQDSDLWIPPSYLCSLVLDLQGSQYYWECGFSLLPDSFSLIKHF